MLKATKYLLVVVSIHTTSIGNDDTGNDTPFHTIQFTTLTSTAPSPDPNPPSYDLPPSNLAASEMRLCGVCSLHFDGCGSSSNELSD